MILNVSVLVVITLMIFAMNSTALAENSPSVYFPVENCINMGDDLESPPDPLTGAGSWGFTLEEKYFGIVRAKGFDTVRIPIRWSSSRSLAQVPYTIDPLFLRRVDQVIDWAMRAGLNIIIDVHHFDELFKNPAQEAPRLVAIWQQLGEHYRNKPSRLMFEIINEPQKAFQGERLNRTQLAALSAIRQTNPTRTVILTGDEMGGITGLHHLRLPANDHHIVASVHSYTPLEFTHQGFGELPSPTGREYPLPGEASLLTNEIDDLITWRKRTGVPVFVGEYGSINYAPMLARGRYTRDFTDNLKRAQIPGCVWSFGNDFSVYDTKKQRWHTPIVEGLQLNAKNIQRSNKPPSDLLIYDEVLGSWLVSASWEGVVATPNTSVVKRGASALAVQFSAWGQELAWQRQSIPLSLRPYAVLRFWIYATPSTGTLQVFIHQQGSDIEGNPVIPPTRRVDFTPAVGAWQEMIIPLKDLGSPTNFFRLTFKGVTQSMAPPKSIWIRYE